jgi:HAD superfamily hydrolase (TIGR01509 family)
MGIDALVFDFDGLILDTEWPMFATVRDEYVAHGLDLTLDEWRHRVGRSDNPHWVESLATAVGSIDAVAVRARRLEAHRAMIDEQEILPGVVELIDEADAAGVPIAVASSSPEDWVVPHLERIGLFARFASITCREHAALGKPAPDLYLAAAATLGIDPTRSVALEDSLHGSVAAHVAGFRCVVVPNEVTRAPRFPEADLVVDSLAEVDLARLVGLVSVMRSAAQPAARRDSSVEGAEL